jgi:hypothetical protein
MTILPFLALPPSQCPYPWLKTYGFISFLIECFIPSQQGVMLWIGNVPQRLICSLLGPQLVALFWKVVKTLGGGDSWRK